MPTVNITYRYPGDINWLPGQLHSFDLPEQTDLWVITIDRNYHRLDEFWQLLNDDEKNRAERYHQIYDRNRFVISRSILRLLLGKYLGVDPASIRFEAGPNKKPFIKDCPISYNVSHSGNRIVIAISSAAVGVDVEGINTAFDYTDIIGEYFSNEEVKYITQQDSIFRFFLLWTRKEAITKTNAKGLDDDLKHVPSLDGVFDAGENITGLSENAQVISFLHGADHLISVVIPDKNKNIRFLDWDL